MKDVVLGQLLLEVGCQPDFAQGALLGKHVLGVEHGDRLSEDFGEEEEEGGEGMKRKKKARQKFF